MPLPKIPHWEQSDLYEGPITLFLSSRKTAGYYLKWITSRHFAGYIFHHQSCYIKFSLPPLQVDNDDPNKERKYDIATFYYQVKTRIVSDNLIHVTVKRGDRSSVYSYWETCCTLAYNKWSWPVQGTYTCFEWDVAYYDAGLLPLKYEGK